MLLVLGPMYVMHCTCHIYNIHLLARTPLLHILYMMELVESHQFDECVVSQAAGVKFLAN